jgi:hypothetical protein
MKKGPRTERLSTGMIWWRGKKGEQAPEGIGNGGEKF